jgi:hypothetical protein
LTDVSVVRTATNTALMIKAISTSETSINFYETARRNVREGCHTRRRENLKSHMNDSVLKWNIEVIQRGQLSEVLLCYTAVHLW